MSISIVIPCYLQSRYVEEAVDSCLQQTLLPESIVVILMDTDSYAKESVLQQKDPRVRCYCKPQMYVSTARNFGYSQVTTSWVYPLDADDTLPPTYLEEVYALRDQADIIYTGLVDFCGDVKIIKPPPLATNASAIVRKHSPINALSTMDAWRAVGGYDETFIEDDEIREYWLHLASVGKTFKPCTTVYLNRRVHGDCRTVLTNKHRLQTMTRLRQMYPNAFKD